MDGSNIEKIIIFGCGGHSRSVADVILFNNPQARLIFVDHNARENEEIFGFQVKKDIPLVMQKYILAIGNNEIRKNKLNEIGEEKLMSVISNSAYIGEKSRIGIGCFVARFSHVGPQVTVGKNSILNTASIIEHEVLIGEHCHIGPNVTICGRVKIGDLVFIGAGTTIIDKINIASNTLIGAGSTVIKDITEAGIYVGTPARRIK